jgi:hypothetical protein
LIDFPDSFENLENPNKKLAKSKQKISIFIAWISPVLNFLGRQSKQKIVFVWISRIFFWISLRLVPYSKLLANSNFLIF